MNTNKIKILIVDDENKSRELLAILVRKNLPEAIINMATHPYVALQMLRECKYDLCLLDYEMPQMNGVEVLKEIRQMKHSPKIILVSAYKDFDFAQKGIEAGALEYLVKPIDNTQVAKALDKYKKAEVEERQPRSSIVFPYYNGEYILDTGRICLIEKTGRNRLRIYLSDSQPYNVTGILSEVKDRLSENFVYISRQCIIDSNRIQQINTKAGEIGLDVNGKTLILQCSRYQMKEITGRIHK